MKSKSGEVSLEEVGANLKNLNIVLQNAKNKFKNLKTEVARFIEKVNALEKNTDLKNSSFFIILKDGCPEGISLESKNYEENEEELYSEDPLYQEVSDEQFEELMNLSGDENSLLI